MLKADETRIRWLIFESGKSMYYISKESGVAYSTVSDIRNEKTGIEKMSFINASKLTKCAEKLIEEQ